MKTKTVTISAGLLLSVFAMIGATGCAADVSSAGGEEPVASESSPLVTVVDYFDTTGLVHTRVKTCEYSAASHAPSASCGIDNGFVLVGGGAEVEGSNSGGGLLFASLPAGATWIVASKDHVTSYAHRIRAYSVGMAVNGLTPDQLNGLVHRNQSPPSAYSNRPTATVGIPAGDIILSGGALVQYNGPGLLLTESYPSSDTTWKVSAKDHQQPDTGRVIAYVISIPVCFNNAIPRCLVSDMLPNSAFVPTGYGLATVNAPSVNAPTGVGGRAQWSGAGRLLTDLFPTNSVAGRGATAYSKDHNFTEGNTTDVWSISIRGF